MIDATIAQEQPVSPEKRKRGRPRNTPSTTPATSISDPGTALDPDFLALEDATIPSEPIDAAPFPAIPPKTNFATLSNYWNNVLTPTQRKMGTVYLYRMYPKLLLTPGRGGRMVNANIEKFNEEDGPITKELIWNKRRMGVYLLRLSQRVVKPSCEISNCELELHGDLTDPLEMPILDLANLDLTYEGNRSYIEVLRSRGALKADQQELREGEEVQASEMLGEIAKDLVSQRTQPQQQPAQPAQTSATDIAGVVTPIIGLLKEQIQQNRPPAEQGTVLEMVSALSNLAKANTPPPQDMKPFLDLQAQNNALVKEMMQRDVDRAVADAQKAREEADSYRKSLPQPKTVDEQFDELERAAKRYERMTGRAKKEDEDDEPPAAPSTAGFLGSLLGSLPLIERIMAHGANMLYNYKVNGSGAALINPAANQPQPAPPQPAAPVAAEPAEETEATLSAEEQEKVEMMQNVVNQLAALEKPMIKFFLEKKSGKEFAKFTIENFGQESFVTVGSVGRPTLLNMLSQYPPVWDIVGPKIAEFSKFLDEFLTYQAAAVQ